MPDEVLTRRQGPYDDGIPERVPAPDEREKAVFGPHYQKVEAEWADGGVDEWAANNKCQWIMDDRVCGARCRRAFCYRCAPKARRAWDKAAWAKRKKGGL